jgi:exopolyphosphatase/guanosine-5'-triphosphate,3'-diphosphate pyrophosphatase
VATAPETIAAVDLGSNSFHLLVAEVDSSGHVHWLDRRREQVQLAAGLDHQGNLSEEATARGIACVARFGDRLREIPRGKVRAVGTNTLRRAHNAAAFLGSAECALGHPIEIIAGREEARLIYLGVAHTQADDRGRRLVIDIGGGSTEFIIGQRFEARHRESLYMGCVGTTLGFFCDGRISEKAMRRAEVAALLELRSIERRFQRIGWTDCIGASGTIKAINSVIAANGWDTEGVTPKGLKRVRQALIDGGSVSSLKLEGLAKERGPIFPGGVAVLGAAFEALDIGHMHVSEGALREGLLYDLLGRIRHEDVRERTIMTMARRYHVPLKFAKRVAATGAICHQQVADAWQLETEEDAHMLYWAALLHEVGLAIAHNQYHKHGAYLVQHSDMRGFSRQNQQFLAALIRGHRRKFPKAELRALPPAIAERAQRLCILLRLAVILNHGRKRRALPALQLEANPQGLKVAFPSGWLEKHPLTRANLEQETNCLKAIGFKLRTK